jgi:hypothetical protein
VEKTVFTSILGKEQRKAEKELEELRQIIQSLSAADSKQKGNSEQGNR